MQDTATRGAAVSEKLKAAARNTGADTRALQIKFVQERLLARLQEGKYRNRFLLKGGLMFSCKSTNSTRPTDDVDLHDGSGLGLQNIVRAIHETAGSDLDDGVQFDLQSFKAVSIRETAHPGVRITMKALIGRSVVPVKLDLCTGDPITPAPVLRRLPSSLPKDFPAVEFRSYPWETALAEKTHAIVKFGSESTRMKDWYDVATIAQEETIDGAMLCEAIRKTFDWRDDVAVDPDPEGFGDLFVCEKSADYARHVFYFNPPDSRDTLEKAVSSARSLILPALEAVHRGETLDGEWDPGKGWSLGRIHQFG